MGPVGSDWAHSLAINSIPRSPAALSELLKDVSSNVGVDQNHDSAWSPMTRSAECNSAYDSAWRFAWPSRVGPKRFGGLAEPNPT